MHLSIKSFITAGCTAIAATMVYRLRRIPDVMPKDMRSESAVIDISSDETPACESPTPTPVPPRPRLISRPTTEHEGLTAKKLLDALALMRPLMRRHPALPVLETVLLEPGQMTVTDLESRLTIQVPELRGPAVCVPALQLQKALRRLKGSVTLTADEGWLRISGEGVQPSLTTFPPQDYPVPLHSGADPSGRIFLLPLRFADVLPAMSKDDSRANLHGVCLDLEHGAIVASNGHVLHLVQGDQVAGESKYLLSATAAKTLAPFVHQAVQGHIYRRTITTGKESTTEVLFHFTAPGVELWTRAVDSEFPDYTQVIPTDERLTRTLVADRAALIAAVGQCLPLTTERAQGIDVRGNATGLVFSVTNPDLGPVTVPVPVQGAEGLTFGISAHYLLAALQTQESIVTIRCTENDPKQGCLSSPLVLNGGPTTAVLMPMRIL